MLVSLFGAHGIFNVGWVVPPNAKPWFKDIPIDWTRPEPHAVVNALETAYDTTPAVVALIKDAGLKPGSFNTNLPVSQLLRDVVDKARVAKRLEQLLVAVFRNGNAEAVHEFLRETLRGFEAEFQAAALEIRPSLALLGRMEPAVAVQGPQGPEALLNAMAEFADPAVFRTKLAATEVAIAQVLIDDEAQGTGFLVGDRYLLTNWHVVKALKGRSGNNGQAVFDHKRSPDGKIVAPGRAVTFVAQNWLVSSSERAADAVEESADGPPDGTLDYALVELAEPAGTEGLGTNKDGDARGKLALKADARPLGADEPLAVLGHPNGGPLMFSFASPSKVALTKTGTRLRYQTNTEPGSSGSPVLDKKFVLVALHHYAVKGHNQGIPIDRIVTELKAKLAATPAVLASLGIA